MRNFRRRLLFPVGVLCVITMTAACGNSNAYTPDSMYVTLSEADAPCDEPVIRTDELRCPSDWLQFGKYYIYFFGGDYPHNSLEASIVGKDACPDWGLGEVIVGSNWWSPGASDELEAYLVEVLGGKRSDATDLC